MKFVSEIDPDPYRLEKFIADGNPVVIRHAVFQETPFRKVLEDKNFLLAVIEEFLGDLEVPCVQVDGTCFTLMGFDNSHRKTLPKTKQVTLLRLRNYLENLSGCENGKSNSVHYVHIRDAGSLSSGFRSISANQKLLKPYVGLGPLNAWIGSGGHRVNTHFDKPENLYWVLCGQKIFQVFSPDMGKWLYPARAGVTTSGVTESIVNSAQPDIKKFPLYSKALQHAEIAVLDKGDLLYLPANWWHNVESKGLNISCNLWWERSSSKSNE
ncbi:cupin-like domain-containing protein [Labrenzia sp. R4_1]|uniref:cupin-like domain-containing protein n=1 Tax=Labrenzia sp. R4_1 TaxID=2821106 RepID=UPI001ADCC963|nr:cupin-like domain-containing protein [Labrenzia sp. R4_1]MBO9424713.1 cupin-like domain-containing protein [Labrenzia sp. R4_1]